MSLFAKSITDKNTNIINNFNKDGFVILKNFISTKTCSVLINEQNKLTKNLTETPDKIIFDTKNQSHDKEKYFFESARKISFFYEPDAFDKNNKLKTDINKSINKIGHALHDLNPVFHRFSYANKIKNILLTLGLIQPQIVQSMYLLKQPKIGNKVDIHQDSTFVYTEPETCLGLWFALENANVDNGCLWAIPRSHKDNLNQRYIKHNNTASIENLNNCQYDLSKAVPLEVRAGDLIILHGRTAHYSNYNNSNKSRHAYALHVVDQTAMYSKQNWLQDNSDMPFKQWS